MDLGFLSWSQAGRSLAGERQSRRDRGVGNGILANDDGTVRERSGDVVGEVCVDDGKDRNMCRHRTDTAEEIDGGFKTAGEKASPALH